MDRRDEPSYDEPGSDESFDPDALARARATEPLPEEPETYPEEEI